MLRQPIVVIAILLFALTFAKGMVWAVVMPIAQQPDEPAHMAVSDELARTGHLRAGPRVPSAALDTTLEATGFHRMVFRDWSIGAMDDVGLEIRADQLASTRGDQRRQPGSYEAIADGYPPLYYMATGAAVRITDDGSFDRSWLYARSVSVFISSLTAVVQLLFFATLFASLVKGTLAALAVNLMPMYSSLESAVNPEVLLVLLGSIMLLLALRVVNLSHRSKWMHVAAGAVLAGLLLTKPNGIALAVPYVIAVLIAPVDERRRDWFKRVGASAALFAIPVIVLYGAWRFAPARPGKSFGTDPLNLLPSPDWSTETLGAYASFLVREGKYRFSDLYWSGFGWVDASYAPWVTTVCFLFTVATLSAAGVLVLQRNPPRWFWVLSSAVVTVIVMLLWVEFGVFTTTGTGMVQGRYLFSVVCALVGIQLWAIDSTLARRPRLHTTAWVLVPLAALALQVSALAGIVAPRYYL